MKEDCSAEVRVVEGRLADGSAAEVRIFEVQLRKVRHRYVYANQRNPVATQVMQSIHSSATAYLSLCRIDYLPGLIVFSLSPTPGFREVEDYTDKNREATRVS